MIAYARVTSKGQVTLPAELRRRLGISMGDDLEFEATDDGALLRVIHRRPLTSFLGALAVEDVLPDHTAERKAAARRRVGRRS